MNVQLNKRCDMKNKKSMIVIGVSILDVLFMAIVMFLVIQNRSVVVDNDTTQSNVSAANVLGKGTDSLDDYIEKEIHSQPKIVYDNMTMEQLAAKLDNSLASTLAGKGTLIASYALEKGVDPYMATAIILHETGCAHGCSGLVNTCNNVGGQKGSGCGEYLSFPTLDDGIRGFIDNLVVNFTSKGLTTPETIGPRYAASGTWTAQVNNYIAYIKAR